MIDNNDCVVVVVVVVVVFIYNIYIYIYSISSNTPAIHYIEDHNIFII